MPGAMTGPAPYQADLARAAGTAARTDRPQRAPMPASEVVGHLMVAVLGAALAVTAFGFGAPGGMLGLLIAFPAFALIALATGLAAQAVGVAAAALPATCGFAAGVALTLVGMPIALLVRADTPADASWLLLVPVAALAGPLGSAIAARFEPIDRDGLAALRAGSFGLVVALVAVMAGLFVIPAQVKGEFRAHLEAQIIAAGFISAAVPEIDASEAYEVRVEHDAGPFVVVRYQSSGGSSASVYAEIHPREDVCTILRGIEPDGDCTDDGDGVSTIDDAGDKTAARVMSDIVVVLRGDISADEATAALRAAEPITVDELLDVCSVELDPAGEARCEFS